MDVASLETSIGFIFKDKRLPERALTHRSWGHENERSDSQPSTEIDNETLEFVGDSVLGLAIAEELFRRHPEMAEGDLTLMKHHLVSLPVLAALAEKIGLGEYLKLGRGEERTGGRKKSALLADALEALIAAVFLDSDYSTARDWVIGLFEDELSRANPRASLDYKTFLQEVLQAAKLKAPVYSLIETSGPPHDRSFIVEAMWEGGKARGEGRSIKQAEMSAAHRALEILEQEKGAV